VLHATAEKYTHLWFVPLYPNPAEMNGFRFFKFKSNQTISFQNPRKYLWTDRLKIQILFQSKTLSVVFWLRRNSSTRGKLNWSVNIWPLYFNLFQCSVTVDFLITWWLFVVFLFISWVIWNNKSINPKQCLPHDAKKDNTKKFHGN